MIKSEEMTELTKKFVTREEYEHTLGYVVANMATKEDIQDLEIKLDDRIVGLEVRLDGVEIRLAGIDTRIDALDTKLDRKFDTVMTILDSIAGSLDHLRLEMAASAMQYARQLEWNHKVAERLDIPFDY